MKAVIQTTDIFAGMKSRPARITKRRNAISIADDDDLSTKNHGRSQATGSTDSSGNCGKKEPNSIGRDSWKISMDKERQTKDNEGR